MVRTSPVVLPSKRGGQRRRQGCASAATSLEEGVNTLVRNFLEVLESYRFWGSAVLGMCYCSVETRLVRDPCGDSNREVNSLGQGTASASVHQPQRSFERSWMSAAHLLEGGARPLGRAGPGLEAAPDGFDRVVRKAGRNCLRLLASPSLSFTATVGNLICEQARRQIGELEPLGVGSLLREECERTAQVRLPRGRERRERRELCDKVV
mmetsp:Transcript_4276/g.8900  ORF Transcript_4276/g.8900 Transcript_4276/m.8900 type:complete len:209 (+) Transcript_4276:407-1033(+)